MRVAYTYFMADAPERVRAVAPAHSGYWRGLGLTGYEGGPFEDRTGGLITFECADLEEARRFVEQDPFVREELVGPTWLKEWRPIA